LSLNSVIVNFGFLNLFLDIWIRSPDSEYGSGSRIQAQIECGSNRIRIRNTASRGQLPRKSGDTVALGLTFSTHRRPLSPFVGRQSVGTAISPSLLARTAAVRLLVARARCLLLLLLFSSSLHYKVKNKQLKLSLVFSAH
jgi:hypothetical protein